jgi:hypothetical protein
MASARHVAMTASDDVDSVQTDAAQQQSDVSRVTRAVCMSPRNQTAAITQASATVQPKATVKPKATIKPGEQGQVIGKF